MGGSTGFNLELVSVYCACLIEYLWGVQHLWPFHCHLEHSWQSTHVKTMSSFRCTPHS